MTNIISRIFGGRSQTGRGIPELAKWLQWPRDGLKSWGKGMPEDYAYNSYHIPKRSGRGYRSIDAPNQILLELQRRVYHKLLKEMKPHIAANGFVPSRSIVDNAKPHIRKAVVINIDLKDFFTNISEERVFNFWRYFNWNKRASRILTNICCYQGRLPQGAPTSPALSNLVNHSMDARLAELVKRMPDGTYTRYADDLTFSFSRYGPKERWFLKVVEEILTNEGYEIQRGKKIRIQRAHQRQTVTGLVVNEKVNLPRSMRRKIRAMQHYRQQGKLPSLEMHKLAGYEALLSMVSKGSGSEQKTVTQPAPKSMKRRDEISTYFSSLFAVLGSDSESKPLGTGFLISHNGNTYAVTCAHVLVDYDRDQTVSLRHFQLEVGLLRARIQWLNTPSKQLIEWNAFDDIAILRIESEVPQIMTLSSLAVPPNYGAVTGCWSFSFQRHRGVRVPQIDCQYPVAEGFVQLIQNGDVKLQGGASGSPLYSDDFGIVGMVQAILQGSRTAYLIPSRLILKILSSLPD